MITLPDNFNLFDWFNVASTKIQQGFDFFFKQVDDTYF